VFETGGRQLSLEKGVVVCEVQVPG
jgi:hypothetical protein